MGLSAGTRLGAYEIVAAIGAGGMGEVYRARDTKLNRDVAIKVLPELFATDPERLARFTREAQTLAALNHPNIATVYGVEHNAIAMELLDGATLREELTGPALPPRKAIDWGMQIARGLAAAHEKGIIHRDLKPENLFVTRDGRIKILDFGVARTAPPCDTVATATSLEPGGGTEPGMVVGTAGYMSPEQVRAQPVDERSDIFSLGTVLYEMLSGARPFRGDSSVETMNAILTQDPPALDEPGRAISPGLERIVRRCLEKRPADRFHSAHDVALALEATSGATTAVIAAPGGGTRWKTPAVVASILAAILLTGVATRAWLPSAQTVQPTFRRLTYQRGTIDGARFAPGSPDVIYSATWEGSGSDVFSAHPQRRQSQSLGHANANLFAVSAAQEIAMILSPRLASGVPMGTLATAPVGGGGARELAARITSADFAGATSELVYAEYTGEATRVMDPAGHVIYQASFPIRNLRCSPAGKAIAILDTSGIAVVDRSGVVTGRIETGPAVTGLAWTGDGRDVLFSEIDEVSQQTTISSARPGARPRVVWRGAGNAALQDARPDGALLVRYDDERAGVLIQQDARAATEFGSSDESLAAAISPAGDAVLINEHFLTPTGEYYTRKVDGSPPVRLGAKPSRIHRRDP